ncbi:MAG: hypothetical protein KBC00_03270 [Candidatus Levybacteria bacterium]|nr:hypothetical protein [Candidatus Levybacteria bacterium]MBP9815586.1 hypothetical protein [Candidatus Levybacteria bacterium]
MAEQLKHADSALLTKREKIILGGVVSIIAAAGGIMDCAKWPNRLAPDASSTTYQTPSKTISHNP